jgi:hypothetical protein
MDTFEIKKYRRGKLIHIRLSPRTHQRLKIRTAELGTNMQRFVSRTVRRALLPPRITKPKKQKVETSGDSPIGPKQALETPIKPLVISKLIIPVKGSRKSLGTLNSLKHEKIENKK